MCNGCLRIVVVGEVTSRSVVSWGQSDEITEITSRVTSVHTATGVSALMKSSRLVVTSLGQ